MTVQTNYACGELPLKKYKIAMEIISTNNLLLVEMNFL